MPNSPTVSNATTYQEIGEFWDTLDATKAGDDEPVEFDVHIRLQRHYVPIDPALFLKVRDLADQRGVSEETLLNLLLQERICQLERAQAA
jgi:hypothetical protein